MKCDNQQHNFTYFYLEDFEDMTLNTPGVTSSHVGGIITSNFHDSVDEDDGVIDGSGSLGKSLWSGNSTSKFTFTFIASTLGNLPTHVGVVWTDSNPTVNDVIFEAFGADGQSLGTIGPISLGDGFLTGQTDEDRFFGVSNGQGISAISLGVASGQNWELDHLQYGYDGPNIAQCLAGDSAIGSVSPDLNIHMPSLNYQSLNGNQNLWADFEYYGQGNNGELLWKLKEYGINQ